METLINIKKHDFFSQCGPFHLHPVTINDFYTEAVRTRRGAGEALREEKPPPGPQEAALRANKLCFPGYNSVMAVIRPAPSA